ncbi:hypothetical protein GpartN1_g6734.t1 [Galdieria partita]|uniref:Uncharacterized protein n=1 Tax=Galdieria partita TaxID=83374 RepID=A0A9C7Q1V3_9RHOD|nr:hypothetical protein GpartN1_g6734.t1 [Galdieria partita]
MGLFSRLFLRPNRVPQKIVEFQKRKQEGYFTYNAGKYDKYVNTPIYLFVSATGLYAFVDGCLWAAGKKESQA